MAAMMRAVVIRGFGEDGGIALGELPAPVPGPNDLLIQIEAVAVNFVDLLVIAGSGFLSIGSVLKFISVATRYNPHILGLSSLDFLLMCGVCWGGVLVLAARTWVQLNEPELIRQRRERLQREESWHGEAYEYSDEPDAEDEVADVAAGER